MPPSLASPPRPPPATQPATPSRHAPARTSTSSSYDARRLSLSAHREDDDEDDDEAPPSSRAGTKRGRSSRGTVASLPGGKAAIGCFFMSLVAYTIQTESAQYVQQALGYRKPFLSLYLGHSGFSLLLPMHLVFLRLAHPRVPLSHHVELLVRNLDWQLRTPAQRLPRPGADRIRRRLSSLSGRGVGGGGGGGGDGGGGDGGRDPVDEAARRHTWPPPRTRYEDHEGGAGPRGGRGRGRGRGRDRGWWRSRVGFDAHRLVGLLLVLMVGITVPALAWYSAVPLTSMAEITTIYNTYAVWALVFSVFFLGERWERRKAASVALACLGVFLVAWGGAEHRRRPKPPVGGGVGAGEGGDATTTAAGAGAANTLLGDALSLVGAVTMAAYEMAFKLLGTLPDEPRQARLYERHVALEPSWRGAADVAAPVGDAAAMLPPPSSSAKGKGAAAALEEQALLDGAEAQSDDDEDDEDAARRGASRWLARPARAATAVPDGVADYQSITPPIENRAEGRARSVDVVAAAASHLGGAASRGPRSARATSSTLFDVEGADKDDEDDDVESAAAADNAGARPGTTRAGSTARRGAELDDDDGDEAELRELDPDGLPMPPPPLPFGLHANVMTAGIGMVTLSTLWMGLPLAHFLGWERFELPPDLRTVVAICVVVVMGIFFNGSFMILLSLWGPVLASVSCLLTTVLVFLADVALGHSFSWVSLAGCAVIALGFGMLVLGEGAGGGHDADEGGGGLEGGGGVRRENGEVGSGRG